MFGYRNIFVGLISIWSMQALIDNAYAQANPPPLFVPGELIVGYKSAKERDDAIRNLDEKNDALRVRGASPINTQVKKVGETGLVLSIDFPEAIKRGTRNNPISGKILLEEVAKQLMESDPKVKYAHPNWIMRLDPPPPHTGGPAHLQLQKFDGGNKPISPQSEPIVPNDPYFYLQWHYQPVPKGMNAVGAWEITKGSNDVVVAVIDSGIAANADFKNSKNILPGYNFVTVDWCDGMQQLKRGPDATDQGGCTDGVHHSWHGTHVAGTIGAEGSNNGVGLAGVAWNVSILPIRVIGRSGSGLTSDVIAAMEWAAGYHVDGVPDNKHPASVINMSLGRTLRNEDGTTDECTPTNKDEAGYVATIDRLREKGVTVVISAGNGEWITADNQPCQWNDPNARDKECHFAQANVKIVSPGGCPGVISVTASDAQGYLAPYSNFGNVTIMAPGGDTDQVIDAVIDGKETQFHLGVLSTIKNAYDVLDGTSMAAPHVSGAIALLLSLHPEWEKNEERPVLVERLLRSMAVAPVAGACPRDKSCGSGQLDARKLLEAHSLPATSK